MVVSPATTTGNLTLNPGMCPDWELNQQPFDLQASTQSLSHTSQDYFSSCIYHPLKCVLVCVFFVLQVCFLLGLLLFSYDELALFISNH